MKKFYFFFVLNLIAVGAMSQKVAIRITQTRHAALSTWQIIDEQNQNVFSGNAYFNDDTVSFSLEENKRYFLQITIDEVYRPDTVLYVLELNGEPILNINSGIGKGDHLFPFFTGTRVRDTKITGGTTAQIADFPWQVYYISGNYRCGGSIISGKWVITAAHCTKNSVGSAIAVSDMSVRVGVNNPSNSLDGKKYLISEVIVHELYDNQTLENDIALLKIKDSINYTNATPIKLLSSSNAAEGATDPGVMSWVTGYGLIKVNPDVLPTSLQKVQLPIVSNQQASAVWTDIPGTDLMAGYLNGNKDACSGDSGGPLVVPVLGEYKLAGIISWGSPNCNTYGAYTRVSMFENWIRSKTGIQIQYMPPAPAGSTIVCQGTESSQYSVDAVNGASTYEWRLYPADAGVISGSSTSASVIWDQSKTGKVSVLVRVTVNNILSDWSSLDVNIVKNTRLISQSGDTTICALQPVSLTVQAEGNNLVYTWYKDNTIFQSGSSNKVVFSSAQAGNSGIYMCEIAGSCGKVLSKNISLTVYPLTAITYISPDIEIPFGSDATLRVIAAGHDLTYQWEKDGISIAGENSDIYALLHVNTSDIGLYQAIVKGTCGTKISDSVYVYTTKASRPGAMDIFVWPTLTSSIFNVALNDGDSYTIQVYSVSGQLMKELVNCRYQTAVDISSYPIGVYLVNVTSGSFRKAIRVIKN